jgi:hypothetical protein
MLAWLLLYDIFVQLAPVLVDLFIIPLLPPSSIVVPLISKPFTKKAVYCPDAK